MRTATLERRISRLEAGFGGDRYGREDWQALRRLMAEHLPPEAQRALDAALAEHERTLPERFGARTWGTLRGVTVRALDPWPEERAAIAEALIGKA